MFNVVDLEFDWQRRRMTVLVYLKSDEGPVGEYCCWVLTL